MMLSETKKVPTVLFKIRKEVSGKSQEGARTPPEMCKAGTWIDQSTDDFFLQKKVIVFSLPGELCQCLYQWHSSWVVY